RYSNVFFYNRTIVQAFIPHFRNSKHYYGKRYNIECKGISLRIGKQHGKSYFISNSYTKLETFLGVHGIIEKTVLSVKRSTHNR
ncbi:MAG: hypothetical protein V3V39_06895, partial [Desulfobacterales bacterium]